MLENMHGTNTENRTRPPNFIYLMTRRSLYSRHKSPRETIYPTKSPILPAGGNLNGLECVRGMLGCMLDIPGDDPVIKIDADTLLMDPAEITRSLKDRGKVAGGDAMPCAACLGRLLLLDHASGHQSRAGIAVPAGMAGTCPSGISGRPNHFKNSVIPVRIRRGGRAGIPGRAASDWRADV